MPLIILPVTFVYVEGSGCGAYCVSPVAVGLACGCLPFVVTIIVIILELSLAAWQVVLPVARVDELFIAESKLALALTYKSVLFIPQYLP